MKKIGILLLAVAGLLFTTDVQAQQSAKDFNFEVKSVENSEESRLVVDKAFKKAKFDEIEINYLPQVIKDVFTKNFEDAVPKRAFVKKEEGINLYKIEIEVDGTTKELYSDINGNWTDQDGIEYI